METDRNLRNRLRAGFTAIEMMVVVSIIIVLVAMVVPSIGPAMKKGTVHDAASAIQRACSQARQLARSNTEPRVAPGTNPKWYGVSVVVPDQANKPAYAVVIYGNTNPSSYSFANDPANQFPNGTPRLSGVGTFGDASDGGPLTPSAKFQFNRGVMPMMALSVPPATPLNVTYLEFINPGSAVGWYYQYRTGFVFNDISASRIPRDVGVPSGASPQALAVGTLDKKYIVAVAIYKIGLVNSQDVN